jgi:hypothetical protein
MIILKAIRVYYSFNRGIAFDLSGVPTDEYWMIEQFLRRYSFLVENIDVIDNSLRENLYKGA